MLNNSVVAVFRNREQARLAVHILDRADFPMERVSLIAVHLDASSDEAKEASYGDDSIHKSFVGAGLGSIVGLLVGATIVAFAGPGVALIAGPVAGLLTGGATGALLGAMEGWGIHKSQLQHYEKLLQQGHALVHVDGDPVQVGKAYWLLTMTDPEELHRHYRSSEDAPEIAEAYRLSPTTGRQ